MATGLMRRPFTALAEMVRGIWSGPLTSSSPELARWWGAPATATGIGVNETTALTYSAFWACVNAIATDCASLPLIHYKRLKSGGKERYTDSKLYRLLHDEPNPEMTSFTFRQVLTAHALTWGGGYAEIQRDGMGRPSALWPLTPNRVTVGRSAQNRIQYEIARFDGAPADVLPAENMLHVPGLGFDGMVGYSVVAKARESIGLGLATERFGGTFFGNGATFGGVISYPGPRPTELSEKNYREGLEVQHQGVNRAHKMLALYNGAKYERGGGIPPEDAQFLETRLHQVEEMCRWFRMPPHKIQHLLRSTNNNIEHQGIEYYTDTLRPWLVRWEQEILRKLIPPSEQRIQWAEHLIDGVLRGDLPSRYAAYAIGRQWGWLCADDICERENMNPLPNGQGQIYLVPMNMAPADRLNEIVDKQVKPEPKPVAPAAPANEPPKETEADRALVAIRAALGEAQQRAEAQLERALEAERVAEERKVHGEAFQIDAERERQAALEAAREAGTLKALLLEAEERSQREHAEREAVEAAAAVARAEAEAALKAAVDHEAMVEADYRRVCTEKQDADQRAETEAAARAEAEAAIAGSRAIVQHLRTSVLGAHRALVVDAWGRMVRRETEKARRHQATPEKLRAWLGPFYETHEDVCVEALRPAMRTHLAWKQSSEDVDTATLALVREHIEESVAQLRALADGVEPEDFSAMLERLLTKWEAQRPEALADRILKEEVDHVAAYHR
jgi:HK97 family phage portal protein